VFSKNFATDLPSQSFQ